MFLALWCLLSLVGGATRAHCLDFGGECSPSAAAPVEPCHSQPSDSAADPGCGSCIDILVNDVAALGCGRFERVLEADGAVQSLPAASHALIGREEAHAVAAAPEGGIASLDPFLRTTVLRI